MGFSRGVSWWLAVAASLGLHISDASVIVRSLSSGGHRHARSRPTMTAHFSLMASLEHCLRKRSPSEVLGPGIAKCEFGGNTVQPRQYDNRKGLTCKVQRPEKSTPQCFRGYLIPAAPWPSLTFIFSFCWLLESVFFSLHQLGCAT